MFGFFQGGRSGLLGFFILSSAEMDLYVPVKVFSIRTGNKEVVDLPGCFVTSLVQNMIKSFVKLTPRT